MATYKLSEQNLLVVMNHLPTYGLDVTSVSSEITNGQLEYTLALSGTIPEDEVDHFNTNGEYLWEIL